MIIRAEKKANGVMTIRTVPFEEEAADGLRAYVSDDGWSVDYDPQAIEVIEEDGGVSFVYVGESAGDNRISVRRLDGQMPGEALHDLTTGWGREEEILRSEGFFPGTENRWGYMRFLYPEEKDGSGLYRSAIAGEYNGGALVFEFVNHLSGDDETDMAVTAAFETVMDSVRYENFAPQTEFSYVPGTYVLSGEEEIEGKAAETVYSVTLNEDHTGRLSLQDDADVLWSSNQLQPVGGGEPLQYDVEGDNLYLELGENWLAFQRE